MNTTDSTFQSLLTLCFSLVFLSITLWVSSFFFFITFPLLFIELWIYRPLKKYYNDCLDIIESAVVGAGLTVQRAKHGCYYEEENARKTQAILKELNDTRAMYANPFFGVKDSIDSSDIYITPIFGCKISSSNHSRTTTSTYSTTVTSVVQNHDLPSSPFPVVNLYEIQRAIKIRDDYLKYWKRKATHLQELVVRKQRQKAELAAILDSRGIRYPSELHTSYSNIHKEDYSTL
ncbi:MAG: hypothetical protein EXX96DRAFT_548411 [Benjaminiella poitrasii]|nr:MAG: hypothetical protein EXX96DRAFT_548411 [Benjaminiella poitrasii]